MHRTTKMQTMFIHVYVKLCLYIIHNSFIKLSGTDILHILFFFRINEDTQRVVRSSVMRAVVIREFAKTHKSRGGL